MKEHDVRKNEILDTAEKLFYRSGYDNTTVAVIIDTVGIAKGTFYHYFRTKEHLLDELVERRFGELVPILEKAASEPGTSALERLNACFSISGAWKAANRKLMLQMLQVLYRDENILLRQKMNRKSTGIFSPIISRIISDGVREGIFDTPKPERAGEMLFELSISSSETVARMILELDEKPENLEIISDRLDMIEYAMERILGAPSGSLHIFDRKLIEVFSPGYRDPHENGINAVQGAAQ